jgi:hypothetical protein
VNRVSLAHESVADPPVAEQGFELKYRAYNSTPERIDPHWDHVAIYQDHQLVHEAWHQQGTLTAAEFYDAAIKLQPLPAGSYTVWLTLDGASAPNTFRHDYRFTLAAEGAAVAGDSQRASGGAGQGDHAHDYHIAVVTAPAPVEPIRAGEEFRIRYEAYNQGGQATPPHGHVDWFRIEGRSGDNEVTWESDWVQEQLDPGQHYWPELKVPGLPPSDEYTLKWKFDVNSDRQGAEERSITFRMP